MGFVGTFGILRNVIQGESAPTGGGTNFPQVVVRSRSRTNPGGWCADKSSGSIRRRRYGSVMRSWSTSALGTVIARFAGWGWVCLWLCGCEPDSLGTTDVKRVHEEITPAEWAGFVRIIERLPEQRLPPFSQPAFPPPPQWLPTRSFPVHDLYAEELHRREECWDSAQLAPVFDRQQSLLRELRKEKLTSEQFAGLLLAVCAATCRSDIPEEIDLAALSDRAGPVLDELAGNPAPFKSLPPESQHAVVQQAMWISRKIRADILRQVPPENVALVTKHRAWIDRALPEEFRTNPPNEIRDLLEEQGLPFEELPDSGFDEDLRWPQVAHPGDRP